MRTMFTGVGTALITPFTKSGALDEAGVKRLAQRQIDAGVHFLVPCGTTGETPTLTAAERRRVVELVLEAAERPGAGDGRRRRLRHAGSRARREGDAERRRPGPAVGDAVLQQADARRPVSALLGDRRRARRCRSCSTTCPAAPAATSIAATLRAAGDDSARRRRQGSVGQHHADGRDLPRGAGGLPRAVRRRCADAAADGDWRPRPDLGGVERDSRRDVADGRSRRARRFRGGAPDAPQARAADAGQLHRVESRPRQVRDGGDGPVRRGLPAADGVAAAGVAGEDSRDPEGVRAAGPDRSCEH